MVYLNSVQLRRNPDSKILERSKTGANSPDPSKPGALALFVSIATFLQLQ